MPAWTGRKADEIRKDFILEKMPLKTAGKEEILMKLDAVTDGILKKNR